MLLRAGMRESIGHTILGPFWRQDGRIGRPLGYTTIVVLGGENWVATWLSILFKNYVSKIIFDKLWLFFCVHDVFWLEDNEGCRNFWVEQIVLFHVNVRCECCKDGDYIFEGQRSIWSLIFNKWQGEVSCGRWKQVDLIIVHGLNQLDNCIVVAVKFIFQQF